MRKIIWATAVLAATCGFFAMGGETPTGKTASATPATQPEIKQQYWFGVAVENIPPAISRHLRMKPNQGLMVFTILKGSPAEQAGLLADDILTEINGKPLTCQDDLFRAANIGLGPNGPKASKVTYLRGGDTRSVDITPAPRPASMIVYGTDLTKPNQVITTVAPNGIAAQVGPGIRIPLTSVEEKTISEVVVQGKTIVLSQDRSSGASHYRITVGEKQYDVDPARVDDLPPEIRDLAKKLVGDSTEERLKRLERENLELKKKLEELAAKGATRPN